ncbi:MAG: Fic family protein [Solirubrobacterales bacterium]|nr:Fic family protein [Solirubrobacterales bacterium]
MAGQPPEIGVLLHRIDVGRGRQELYLDQLPELLEALAESARIASIRASNAIEGVDVDLERARQLATGARFRNRNEKEFAGYRDAIDGIMSGTPEPPSVPLLLHLHRQVFQHVDGRGGHLKQDQNLIVSYAGGRREVIFEPPTPAQTPFMLAETIERYLAAQGDQAGHPLILLGAFALDVLAIHPVADGNGRLARLATTSELMRLDYRIARYASVEQRIYDTKNGYYAALYESQRGWHDGRHSIWPWVEYLTRTLADSYDAFEQRVVAERSSPRRSKRDRVRRHVLEHAPESFRLADLRLALPGISDETIRAVLQDLKEDGQVVVEGHGRGARWRQIARLGSEVPAGDGANDPDR